MDERFWWDQVAKDPDNDMTWAVFRDWLLDNEGPERLAAFEYIRDERRFPWEDNSMRLLDVVTRLPYEYSWDWSKECNKCEVEQSRSFIKDLEVFKALEKPAEGTERWGKHMSWYREYPTPGAALMALVNAFVVVACNRSEVDHEELVDVD